MDLERWRQIDALLLSVLEREAGDRVAFLEQACAGDESLKTELESLLSSGAEALGLFETPAFESAAALLSEHIPALVEGQPIGHYQVLSFLGAGGMGEVYLAEDTKLRRKIALKLLPGEFTRHQERLRRFQQEAQAASALNHPNILTIHELGEVDGRQFIATEFVEGETLRERLKRSLLTLAEALDIAIQIASALATAHKAGIIHRDIKPENIMLRHDGYVKVLDFGLAKLTEQAEPAIKMHGADDVNISSGLVMGTVKYMSPEQACGQQVDLRSDIFSFGVVLYEMIAGDAPFNGKDSNELVSAIVKKEPAPLAKATDEMQRLVGKALSKKKEDRYQTIEEFLVDLKSLREDQAVKRVGAQTASPRINGSALATSEAELISTATTVQHVVSGIKRYKTTTALIVVTLAIIAVGLVVGLNRLGNKKWAARKPAKTALVPNGDKAVSAVISPNGEYIAYAEMTDVGQPSAQLSLWVQELATNRRTQIVPPAEVEYGGLTYSRDGANIFYVSKNMLYRISATGGEVTKVSSDVDGGISFAPDGSQFAFVRVLNEETALMVANSDGSGERLMVKRKRPEFLESPTWSPDGGLIACATGVLAKNQMGLIGFAVTTGEEKKISDRKWDELSGRMTWVTGGSLMISAVENGQNGIWQVSYPSGEAYLVISDSFYDYYDLSVTNDGRNLVAIKFASRSGLWVMPQDNPGSAKPITSGEHYLYRRVAWTPDDRILYASSTGNSRDIWIMNRDGTEPRQLTANAGVNLQPQPSGDGHYIVFSSNRANKGAFNLWRMDLDGSNPLQLTHGKGEGQPVCSPDGRWVVYSAGGPSTTPWQKTLWKVSIDGGEPVQLADKPSSGAAISRDGALVACWYAIDPLTRDSSATMKIALIPFAGGPPIKMLDAMMTSNHPVRWSRDGRSIDYIDTHPFVSNIWSQPIDGGSPQQVTQFTSELIEGFDWSRDGTLVCSRLHRVQDIVIIGDFR